jgi:polyisoprenoid-binding protein YceI
MTFEKWEIDSGHSGIHFSVRHMVVAKVRGKFARWHGGVLAEDGDLARAQVDVVIDASSVETGVAARDAHLKSPDFLDVTSFPWITFKSSGVEKRSDDLLRVTGDLTIRGVTHEVSPRR